MFTRNNTPLKNISMKKLIGGLAGAIALNIIHETYRRFDDKAPRVELIGEEAVTKIFKVSGCEAPTGNKLYATALIGDVVSNAAYFSLIGIGKKKNVITRGAIYGAAAGAGALLLTEPLGLKDAPVTRSTRTKVLTVCWYLIGGIVAAASIKALSVEESD